MHPAEHLGGKDNVLAAGVTLDRTADDLLGRPVLVGVRRVPEGDAHLDGLAKERLSILVIQGPGVRVGGCGIPVAHAAQRDSADLQTRLTQAPVLHRPPLPVTSTVVSTSTILDKRVSGRFTED